MKHVPNLGLVIEKKSSGFFLKRHDTATTTGKGCYIKSTNKKLRILYCHTVEWMFFQKVILTETRKKNELTLLHAYVIDIDLASKTAKYIFWLSLGRPLCGLNSWQMCAQEVKKKHYFMGYRFIKFFSKIFLECEL